jgi:hypothetical protein
VYHICPITTTILWILANFKHKQKGAFNLFEEYYSNDGATRLRACKLAAGRIKLAVAQTSDAAFPPLR